MIRKFKNYNPIGNKELNAAIKVIKSGKLSYFLGTYSKEFYGGPKVREFERKCKSFFKVKHAITVNSWTSGLVCAVGAIDINPGNYIITLDYVCLCFNNFKLECNDFADKHIILIKIYY